METSDDRSVIKRAGDSSQQSGSLSSSDWSEPSQRLSIYFKAQDQATPAHGHTESAGPLMAADIGAGGERSKGSSAEEAGLTAAKISREGEFFGGDIIVSVNGKKIESVSRLLATLDDYRIGTTVRLGVKRGNQLIEVPVRLQAASER
jgi:S1-C subfamily serine protease